MFCRQIAMLHSSLLQSWTLYVMDTYVYIQERASFGSEHRVSQHLAAVGFKCFICGANGDMVILQQDLNPHPSKTYTPLSNSDTSHCLFACHILHSTRHLRASLGGGSQLPRSNRGLRILRREIWPNNLPITDTESKPAEPHTLESSTTSLRSPLSLTRITPSDAASGPV